MKVREWVFRASALSDARAWLNTPGGEPARAHTQARLLMEVARGVREPADALPVGERSAVELGLYRDAIYWALASRQPPAPTPAEQWDGCPPDRLLAYAGGAERLAVVRDAVCGNTVPVALDTSRQQVDEVRAFAEALLEDLEEPRRRVGRILAQRWGRITVLALAVVAVALGARKLVLGPNLVEGRSFRTSSTFSECGSFCDSMLFHTREQDNPWIEFDLGAPKTIRRVEVTNRKDCCGDRAVPLVVEVSQDASNWTEVARRTELFRSWAARFSPRLARYVRFKVLKHTAMHFHEVAVR